ncbi:MAG: isoprenoid biosynthesis glyoxalase ElbB [Myxococcota bacterium]|nr:isoprenoid biosynthesis glyoxalase ElbB [Myxococcota bacterium]
MKKVAVVLSGCGNRDGSEIHESVITLLALDRAGVSYACFAPDADQPQVIDHRTGERIDQKRNMLAEAARIARGTIEPIGKLDMASFDGLALPGGLGAAIGLSDFASRGSECRVRPEVGRGVADAHLAGKPILAICIAPAVLAKALVDAGVTGVRITIGDDRGTAAKVEATGQVHVDCPVDGCVVDERHKAVTTPAYMLASRVSEAAAGIEKAVAAFVRML